ncbi:MAG: hypothetical protein IKM97_03890 [Clostridia bacterium]|nr:hypothetical protein [Clostridia bacterium]
MRKINDNLKKKLLLKYLKTNLNICDIIIMKIFSNYTIKVYRMGLNDAFYWNNKKLH